MWGLSFKVPTGLVSSAGVSPGGLPLFTWAAIVTLFHGPSFDPYYYYYGLSVKVPTGFYKSAGKSRGLGV